MPQVRRTLSTAAMAAVTDVMFAAPPEELFGLELEWPVHRLGDVSVRPNADDVVALNGTYLPAGGRLTFEPGGQVELSTATATSVVEAIRAARDDTRELYSHMETAGLVCETLAVDDRRPPRRILERPRYSAMEGFFAQRGATGSWMMTNTASTQVNLSHDPCDTSLRWQVLNRISPVLIAAFANSPGIDLEGRRWASLRQAIWWSIDPSRTRPVHLDRAPSVAWQEYALAAEVMFVCEEGTHGASGVAIPPGLTFGRWMSEGHELGWPTIDDFRYHLTTLFPPVRPRGWLELRVLDALPEWIRDIAALTVATACTRSVSRDIASWMPDTAGLWVTATRDGLGHPVLAAAARALFEIVTHDLSAVSSDPGHVEMLAEFRSRYVDRGRSPGDDLVRQLDMRQHHLTDVPVAI